MKAGFFRKEPVEQGESFPETALREVKERQVHCAGLLIMLTEATTHLKCRRGRYPKMFIGF